MLHIPCRIRRGEEAITAVQILIGPMPDQAYPVDIEVAVVPNLLVSDSTVEQLPISKGIAGVSMRLEPGVMRELHWHATAAEWAFVIDGRVRTTVVDPQGRSGIDDFGPGDIWYFPRGHGHMLQCLGDEPCHFILVFDNGYFSEFGTFSVSDWLSRVPPALLATICSAHMRPLLAAK